MKDDRIKRSDAIKAVEEAFDMGDCYCDRYGIRGAINAIPSADIPKKVIAQITFDEEKLREIVKEAVERFKEEYEIIDSPQEWIPCSERLPEEDGYYLITLDFEWGREIEIGLWTDGEWFNDNRHANIAWMPLPEPWKGADDDSKGD